MSFHENTEELVKGACMLEYSHATAIWGKTYNSLHEGWAVLKEELEEVEFCHKQILHCFDEMWKDIKIGGNGGKTTEFIQRYAVTAMKELAQVWAVCEKMKRLENQREKG